MKSVLFVSNGHGEAAIADRIAAEVRSIAAEVVVDHLALVGETPGSAMHEVGPRGAMPSGGLVAMGNVRNLLRDLRAGLAGLTFAQARFLRERKGVYGVAVAVGDVYGLAMTLLARSPTVFVGTAKSVSVAPYGWFEERLLRRATSCFVRDAATARALQAHGVRVEPPANVIVDLFATRDDRGVEAAVRGFAPALALFPGSRQSAYEDAAFLLEVVRELAAGEPELGGVLSVARGLQAERFAADARRAGWGVHRGSEESIPFSLRLDGREIVRAWTGAPAQLLGGVAMVLGQAGTANEGAAAAGVPVVAFQRDRDPNARWYRRRQQGLLGDALAVFPGTLPQAVAGVRAILDDPAALAHMSETGRARMGEAGGAHRVAERIVSLATSP